MELGSEMDYNRPPDMLPEAAASLDPNMETESEEV